MFVPTMVMALWASLLGFVPLFEMGWSFSTVKNIVLWGLKVFRVAMCSSAQGFWSEPSIRPEFCLSLKVFEVLWIAQKYPVDM